MHNSRFTEHAVKIQSLLAKNNTADALRICTRLCKKHPDAVEVWYLTAGVYSQMGHLRQAAECCRNVIAIDPTHFGAHYNLGVACQALQQFQQAVDAYTSALRINSEHGPARTNLGIALYQAGDLNGAKQLLGELAAREPDNTTLLLHLGLTERSLGNLDAAIALFRRCVELQPGSTIARYQLGVTLKDSGNSQAARQMLETAVESDSGFIPALYSLAVEASAAGDYEYAENLFTRILAIDPDNADAIAGLASIHHYRGDDRRALLCIEPWLEKQSVSPNILLVYAAISGASNLSEDAIRVLRGISKKNNTPSIQADINFALGDLLDKAGRYDEAFECFRIANEAARPASYRREDTTRYFDRLMSVFSTDAIQQLPRASNASDVPVFILGMPRSGTSLVEQILASHPEVYGAGELGDMGRIANSIGRRSGSGLHFPESVTRMTQSLADELSGEYLDRLATLSSGSKRVTDKMPHNFLALGLIYQLLPSAKVIHCMRNPIDTCLSIYFHNFTSNHPYTFDLEDLAFYYKVYARLMEHWDSVLPSGIIQVKYEDMVSEPEQSIRALLEYCEIPWDPRCLDFHENRRVVSTPSYQQVVQPIYTGSANRWTHYKDFIGPLVEQFPDAI